MAYMSQEKKKSLEPAIKAILKKYGIKGRVGVKHHSTLVLNITEGGINFIENTNRVNKKRCEWNGEHFIEEKNYIQVNHFYVDKFFDGKAADFLNEIVKAMNVGNYDNSDIQTDYFDVGFHIDINIGTWNKPYVLVKKEG